MALIGVRKRKEKKGDNDVVIFLIQVFKWIKKIKKMFVWFILPKLTFQSSYALKLIINKFENNMRCLKYMECVEQ